MEKCNNYLSQHEQSEGWLVKVHIQVCAIETYGADELKNRGSSSLFEAMEAQMDLIFGVWL